MMNNTEIRIDGGLIVLASAILWLVFGSTWLEEGPPPIYIAWLVYPLHLLSCFAFLSGWLAIISPKTAKETFNL